MRKGLFLKSVKFNSFFGDLEDVDLSGLAQGDIVYYNGTGWVRLATGTAGKIDSGYWLLLPATSNEKRAILLDRNISCFAGNSCFTGKIIAYQTYHP